MKLRYVEGFNTKGFHVSSTVQQVSAYQFIKEINDKGPQKRTRLCQILRHEGVPVVSLDLAAQRILMKLQIRGMVDYKSNRGWTTP